MGDFQSKTFYDNPESITQFLKLSLDEAAIIHSLLSPIYDKKSYSAEQVYSETIARCTDLYFQGGVSPKIVDKYCGEVQAVVHVHLSSVVKEMAAHHLNWCGNSESNLMGNQSFQFCIAELTGN